MRPSCCCFWAALLLLVGVCAAQGPTPSPSDCNAEIVALVPCLDYVQGNVSTPSASCCTGLAGVVQSRPTCLCALANGSALPIQVDPIRATGLPTVCNVSSPTIICGSGPVAPIPEPVSSPPASPPATVPTAAPPATPVVTPSAPVAPPTTPATPTTTPILAPAVPPAVAPTVPPPAPTTAPTVAPPGLAPTPGSPLSSSSPPAPPPAPPPAEDNSNHGATIAASFLLSGFAMVLSSFLF